MGEVVVEQVVKIEDSTEQTEMVIYRELIYTVSGLLIYKPFLFYFYL